MIIKYDFKDLETCDNLANIRGDITGSYLALVLIAMIKMIEVNTLEFNVFTLSVITEDLVLMYSIVKKRVQTKIFSFTHMSFQITLRIIYTDLTHVTIALCYNHYTCLKLPP